MTEHPLCGDAVVCCAANYVAVQIPHPGKVVRKIVVPRGGFLRQHWSSEQDADDSPH